MTFLKDIVKNSEEDVSKVKETVTKIIEKVRSGGDDAIVEMTENFDGIKIDNFKVSDKETKKAYDLVDKETVDTLNFAAERIKMFAKKQLECLKPLEYEDSFGNILGHKLIPFNSCACYIPGGRYPLPSTALMSALVAKTAGVKRIIACSPPSKKFLTIDPSILVALDIAGADEIYCVGGAQAIAACVYGTETITPVDFIVGPGNKFINEAKRQVMGDVGVDSLSGPSELLILADDSALPKFVIRDLLALAEHDPVARTALVTTSEKLANHVLANIEKEAAAITNSKVALKSWKQNGQIVLLDTLENAIDFTNEWAPEHLEVQTSKNDEVVSKLLNFGSLFIGHYSPHTFGDYVSGPNHILPTMRTSRHSNGLWVGEFIRVASYQQINEKGAIALSNAGCNMAKMEGLFAHKQSIEVRSEK